MTKSLKDYGINELFNGTLLITDASTGIAGNGNRYLTLHLADKTGETEAKVWSSTPEIEARLTAGTVVQIDGSTHEYQSKMQIRISNIVPVEGADPSDYVSGAPIEKEILRRYLANALDSIKNPTLQALTSTLVRQYGEDVMNYPAAKRVHHNYASGLAHHIYGMLKLADAVCTEHSLINRDLLTAGIILHDLGKIDEYTGVVGTDFTLEGQLIGHISIMHEQIGVVARSLGLEKEKETLLLKHVVLAHHGKLEYGSPTRPRIIEAEVLHQIDMLDANINVLEKALGQTKVGEFTDKVWSLDNRKFLNHGLSEQ